MVAAATYSNAQAEQVVEAWRLRMQIRSSKLANGRGVAATRCCGNALLVGCEVVDGRWVWAGGGR